MNEIFLDDGPAKESLSPLALTRSVADIRIGILTIREKWEKFFGYTVTLGQPTHAGALIAPSNIIPDQDFITSLKEKKTIETTSPSQHISLSHPWQIFQLNDMMIRRDFDLLTNGRTSAPLSATNKLTEAENIFAEPGARVEHCILNASAGPIYIGKNAEVMEGSMIRGPFALCEGAIVKMGAKIYGATTIGPYSIVGGEIKNSVISGYSNKAHDGYLGDSVIGEWCNLGAGTSNSNVKNNAGDVSVWDEHEKKFIQAGIKCGLLMGDYSRSAINTSFNTGTVVGVCCNIFGEGLTPKYIPSFSWGYAPLTKYRFENAIKDISNWKKLKNHSLSDIEIKVLKHIFEQS